MWAIAWAISGILARLCLRHLLSLPRLNSAFGMRRWSPSECSHRRPGTCQSTLEMTEHSKIHSVKLRKGYSAHSLQLVRNGMFYPEFGRAEDQQAPRCSLGKELSLPGLVRRANMLRRSV